MSAQVIKNFLPILLAQAESNSHIAPQINSIFPKHIQKICPVPAIHLQENFDLKWPTVALACIAGGSLSLLAGGRMIARSASKKGFFTWGFALLWYGVMCFGGLFYHCIKPSPVFRNVDVIATACSSISVVAGSILADDTALSQRIPLLAVYVSTAIAAICGAELVSEFLYVGPTAVAILAAAWFIWRIITGNGVKRCKDQAVKWWCAFAAGGAAVGLGSLVCDKWLCVLFGSNFLVYFFRGMQFCAFRALSNRHGAAEFGQAFVKLSVPPLICFFKDRLFKIILFAPGGAIRFFIHKLIEFDKVSRQPTL